MVMDLSNLTVLITGGGGIGVGKGVCQVLDDYGAKLWINELSKIKAEEAAHQYKNAQPVQADVSKGQEIKNMFRLIQESGDKLNGLVNNAGVGLNKAIHKIDESEFDRVFNVNIRGMWMVTKAFAGQLLAQMTTGNIVNVSSVHAHSSQPNYSTYASTKAAVEGFTRATAYELGQYNIRCNAIAPGMVHAEQNLDLIKTWAPDPQKWVDDHIRNQQVLHHFIQPEDCGNAVAFLLSDLSKSITGQTIYVDAGKTIMLFNKDYIDQQ